jgi:hypothetical protein
MWDDAWRNNRRDWWYLCAKNVELPLAHRLQIQQWRMSMALDRFCLTVFVAIPLAVLLLVAIGVAG